MITLYTLSSLASILPEPSASKRSNASLISCFCSSVSSFLGAKDRNNKNTSGHAGHINIVGGIILNIQHGYLASSLQGN